MDRLLEEFFNVEVMRQMLPGLITEAMKNTLVFTILSFTGGLALGLVLALMRMSPRRALRWPSAVYTDIFRGLPALLVIVFVGFGVPIAFPGLQYPFPRYTPGVVALSIVASAYVAETIRAGIEAVPRGQMEAARSLGMTHYQAMRYIVLPQAIRNVMPALGNDLIAMLKDSSLVSVLGVREMTQVARLSVSTTFRYEETYFILTLFYLSLTLILSLLLQWVQRRAAVGR